MNDELFEYLYATEQVDECFGLKEQSEVKVEDNKQEVQFNTNKILRKEK